MINENINKDYVTQSGLPVNIFVKIKNNHLNKTLLNY